MIRHLLATDLRRFRWTLAAWTLLVIAYAALLWITPGYVTQPLRHNALSTAIVLVFLVTHLAPLVLVPLVIQADAPVGTNVFWATRPIPPRALLAAKTLLIALAIVALPLVFELAAMIAADVPSGEIVRIALDTIVAALIWVTLLMAGSAITPSYPKFALLCVSVVVALACSIVIVDAIVSSRAEGTVAMASVGVGLPVESEDSTRFFVFAGGLVLSGCALLMLQYVRRQRLVSVPAGAGGLALAFLAASWWPWPLLSSHESLPAWTATGPRLAAASTILRFDRSFAADRPWRFGHLDMRVAAIQPGWVARVRLRDASLTLPDGAVVNTRARWFMALPSREDGEEPQMRVAIRQLLSVSRLSDPHGERGDDVTVFAIGAEDYPRVQSATMVYRGAFAVELTRMEIAGAQPLAPGVLFDDGTYKLRLLETRGVGANAVTYDAIETTATSMLDPAPARSYAVYAVNRSRSEALEAMVFPAAQINEFAGFGVHATLIPRPGFTRHGVHVIFPQTYRSNGVVVDDDWLKDAQLVVVRSAVAGHVERTIEISGVTACTPINGKC